MTRRDVPRLSSNPIRVRSKRDGYASFRAHQTWDRETTLNAAGEMAMATRMTKKDPRGEKATGHSDDLRIYTCTSTIVNWWTVAHENKWPRLALHSVRVQFFRKLLPIFGSSVILRRWYPPEQCEKFSHADTRLSSEDDVIHARNTMRTLCRVLERTWLHDQPGVHAQEEQDSTLTQSCCLYSRVHRDNKAYLFQNKIVKNMHMAPLTVEC